MSIGNFPESLSQAILAGIISVGTLGVGASRVWPIGSALRRDARNSRFAFACRLVREASNEIRKIPIRSSGESRGSQDPGIR